MNAKPPTPGLEEIELRVGESSALRVTFRNGDLESVKIFSSDGPVHCTMSLGDGVSNTITIDMVRKFALELLVAVDSPTKGVG